MTDRYRELQKLSESLQELTARVDAQLVAESQKFTAYAEGCDRILIRGDGKIAFKYNHAGEFFAPLIKMGDDIYYISSYYNSEGKAKVHPYIGGDKYLGAIIHKQHINVRKNYSGGSVVILGQLYHIIMIKGGAKVISGNCEQIIKDDEIIRIPRGKLCELLTDIISMVDIPLD